MDMTLDELEAEALRLEPAARGNPPANPVTQPNRCSKKHVHA